MNPYGGSQKMEMKSAAPCMTAITAAANTQMDGEPHCSAAPVKKSCCGPGKVMPSLFGEISGTIAGRSESTAPFSETNHGINHPSLSDRLTQSLISAGLVKGIIPMSMRVRSNQQTLDIVSNLRGGGNAE